MIDVLVPEEQEGTKAVVRAWLKSVGDRVEENDPIVELETDKVAVEVPAPAAGVLREIVLHSNEEAAPGKASASVSSNISLSTPAAGAGTSTATLSVSSSTSGSFTATRSPTCFSQARTTAWVPSCSTGTMTSIMTRPLSSPQRRLGSRGEGP